MRDRERASVVHPVAGPGFGLDHLPWGVVDPVDSRAPAFVAVRLGDTAVDVAALLRRHDDRAPDATRSGDLVELVVRPTLDDLLAAGATAWTRMRAAVRRALLADDQPPGAPVADVEPGLAFTVADFVDFYASEDHATNVGRLFRPDQPLLDNWHHVPIGYHGRSGTVRVSGTPVRRPRGMVQPDPEGAPVHAASARLDYEVEVGFVTGPATAATPFDRAVFGVALVNDWSARDIQAFEYRPLGPFLGKSFMTSIAAWITPLDALSSARTSAPPRRVPLAPHLDVGRDWALDLHLEVLVNGHVVARPPAAGLSWTPAQMLAHLTSNGTTLRPGDLYASGTVSGPHDDQVGSLLERTRNGTRPTTVGTASRTYLEDGDEVVVRGRAPGPDGDWIHLAEVSGTVLPATS